MKGIDVSRWQGEINWKAVKNDGIDFAIIKAGGSDDGFYKDSRFEENYKNAKEAGLSVGSYYFVGPGCVSSTDGAADAKRFLDIIKGKQFDMPVYIDIETTPPALKREATDAVIAFCEALEKAGYYVGIYASDISGFKDRLDCDRLADYDKWVAKYGAKPIYVKSYGMWQISSSGTVNGVKGYVDIDEAYKDYPNIIKKACLNGYKGFSLNNSSTATKDKVYIVKSGDTLTKIATINGTTVSKLVADNKIKDPNLIYPGQKIIVKK